MKEPCFILLVLFTTFCAFGQNADQAIAAIDESLSKGQAGISDILSDEKYMYLHSLTPFRDVIAKHAKAEKITMVTPNEPGKKITVKAIITTADGKPLDNALVYLYHTSDKGWYSDTGAHIRAYEGDVRYARLFCYVKTDNKGQFEIETSQPKGYPNSDLPAHIHMEVSKNGEHVAGLPGELLFDDDPRLTSERRARSVQEAFVIEKDTGTPGKPVYFYRLQSK